MLLAGAVRADDGEPPHQPKRTLPSTASLDGRYLWLGPVAGAVAIDGAWDSAFGGEVAGVCVQEHRALAAAGLGLGATRYAKRDGGKLWLEALAGTRRIPGHALLGASLGPAVEISALQHVRPGVTASVWMFVGVTPYVRAGWFAEAGPYAEVGLSIALPVLRRR